MNSDCMLYKMIITDIEGIAERMVYTIPGNFC